MIFKVKGKANLTNKIESHLLFSKENFQECQDNSFQISDYSDYETMYQLSKS